MKNKILAMGNILLFGMLLGFGVFFFTKSDAPAVTYAQEPTVLPSEVATLADIQGSFRLISERTIPSVVELQVVEYVEVPSFSFFGFGFNDDTRSQEVEGLGSGVIVRRAGNTYYVLTNDHVAGSAEDITVVLHDKRSYKGSLIGTNGERDLALVSFESDEDLAVAPMGDSDDLYVGDWVLAVGSPFGYGSTVTAGIVSALDRSGDSINNLNNFIQTDAAINQGNSGGPLINIYGEVVGINTWIATTSGSSAGLGFAIPINNAKKLIDDFIDYGRVVEGWVGISMASDEYAQRIFDNISYEGDGVFVQGVYTEASALAEKLNPGDIITHVNGAPVSTAKDISLKIKSLSPGDRITIDYVRQGEKGSASGRINERPDDSSSLGYPWPYSSVLPLSDDIRRELDVDNSIDGVVLSLYVDSPLRIAGLQHLDIITKVNDTEIKTVDDFYRAINEDVDEFSFYYNRNGVRGFVGVIK